MRQKSEDKITKILKKIAPGTPIRDGLENILKARTGALLLFTDNEEYIKQLVDGGFFINEDYTSSKLYELAKMDGAIVLSADMKKILFAILLCGAMALGLVGCSNLVSDSKKELEDAKNDLEETYKKYGWVEKETVNTILAKFNTEIMDSGLNTPASDD